MSSFATHYRRLNEPDMPPYRRLSNLRACIVGFAPYGSRSTYFYLTLSAGIPRTLQADPVSIIRAADELHEARTIWQAGISPLLQRRRELKRSGRRNPPVPAGWISRGGGLTDSDDPRRIPEMPLAAFIQRRIECASGIDMTGCRVCGELRGPISHSTGHGFIERCRQCGELLRPCRCGAAHRGEARRFEPLWLEIWHRHHMNDDGRPDDRWPGWETPAR